MKSLLQNLRYAARALLHRPLVVGIAFLTLTLGVAANTAIFTVIDSVLLSPLPFEDPDRLVAVWESNPQQGKAQERPSPANFVDWEEASKSFDGLAFWHAVSATLEQVAEPEELEAFRVSENFFEVLGVKPAAGRVFAAGDAEAGVVLVSHGFWQRRYGTDPGLVGRGLVLDGESYTVVGVLPAGFAMPTVGVDIWLPRQLQVDEHRKRRYLAVIGRLARGVTLDSAASELDTIAVRLEQAYPDSNTGYRIALKPLREQILGDVQGQLKVALGAVLCVLLIVCANVAALLSARAAGRRQEMALRTALGANRGQLLRQLLLESVLLGVVAGLAALAAAHFGLQWLLRLEPGDLPRATEISLGSRVLLVNLAVAVLASVVCGVLPAIRGITLQGTGTRGSTKGAARHRGLRLLVVGEIAIALVLLIGAGLLVRSLGALRQVDPGFATEGVLTARVALDGVRYGDHALKVTYLDRLLEELRALPGVSAAGAVTALPLSPVGIDFDRPYQPGGPTLPENEAPRADFRVVTAGYFEAIGIPLRSGRTVSVSDRADSGQVVVINEELARQGWPGEDPVGQWVHIEYGQDEMYQVVGVVGDTRHYGLAAQPRPQLFVVQAQIPWFTLFSIALRTEASVDALRDPLRRTFLAVDSSQPANVVNSTAELLAASLARERFLTLLLTLTAVVALLLAAVGVYGVMAYAVSERRQDIGIRMTVGAERGAILRLVVGEGVRLAVAGTVLGLVAAWAASGMIRGLLFGVAPRDPLTFAGVSLLLLGIAVVASLLPALRATRVDPIEVLRQE